MASHPLQCADVGNYLNAALSVHVELAENGFSRPSSLDITLAIDLIFDTLYSPSNKSDNYTQKNVKRRSTDEGVHFILQEINEQAYKGKAKGRLSSIECYDILEEADIAEENNTSEYYSEPACPQSDLKCINLDGDIIDPEAYRYFKLQSLSSSVSINNSATTPFTERQRTGSNDGSDIYLTNPRETSIFSASDMIGVTLIQEGKFATAVSLRVS
ncbi:hypothetical protein M422DRAFT_274051 [Sphaerobolus stellatus SS14]|uniref:Uncharacterized protein n=1 Tax=Sphaerobolus stellatus (strain SS14) TaxID=990650 RepID=A0A0C9UI23_SPHS4|nr:hypothetical protein M422DRAFT_274051 [Sphaerobolus stellatus SS14]